MNLLSFIALFVAGISALGAGIQFPSAASSESPDGTWKLTCKGPAKGSADLRHLLLLTRLDGGSFVLRRFDRGCDALWSSDSSHLAITDWLASSESDVFVYSLGDPVSSKSVAKLFPQSAIPKAERRGHCYFEAIKWLDRRRLQIRVSGHRDEPPANSFEYEYIFDLTSGGFKNVTKKKPNQSVHRTGASRFAQSDNPSVIGGWLPSLTFFVSREPTYKH